MERFTMPETRAALTRRRAESNNARAAEPVAAALALLSPRGLGRLSCSSRLWRDAAAKVGAPLHVYAISSHSSDLDGGEGEHYGIAYLGQEPPPFDCCRGPSGGVLELSLIGRDDARDDGARQWPDDVDSDVEMHVGYAAVTVTCSGPAVSECVDPVIRALNASGVLEQDIDEEDGKIRFDAIGAWVLKFAPNRLARLPRACDFLPMPLLRQIAQKIVEANGNLNEGWAIMGVDWASSLLGVAPPQDFGPPLTLSDLRDRLRITRFEWEAPRRQIETPNYDATFLWRVLLREGFGRDGFVGDLEYKGLVDRVLGPHISTRPPSAGEKQEFADLMNTLDDDERALYFKMVFRGVQVDRALEAEAKFTVPLLDGVKVLHLNIWREIIRREHGLHLVG